jgi:coenzyme F420-reducing hydrogenase beta subunit
MQNERPVVRLTHDPQVVRDAMMSKYGPVPMLATLIPELLRRPRRVAITCTPCQLGGWLRACGEVRTLRKSQVLSIGVFCGQVQSYDSLTAIAATLAVKYPGEAKFVAWRSGSYPGSVRFERPDGSSAEKPLYSWLDVAVPHFSLHRCFLCPDGGNWLADMTLGDIHSGGIDETVIVCRSREAEIALQSARDAGRIELHEMTPPQVESCVINAITRSKMLPAIAWNASLKRKGSPTPDFDYDAEGLLHGQPVFLRRAWMWKYRLTFWARTGWRRPLLLRHPLLLEKTGHFLYYFPSTIPGWRLLARLRKRFARALTQTEFARRRI